jgi:prepilin-type N-terminal cleavage/methylation domain-containing protein
MKIKIKKWISLIDSQKGFTLVEVMITVAIIGIVSVVGIGSYMAMRPTKNMHADGRDLISNLQLARLEAVKRNTCVGVTLTPVVAPATGGSYTIFFDNGFGGPPANACNATIDGNEGSLNPLVNPTPARIVIVKEGVTLTQSPVAATAADQAFLNGSLFESISFNSRSMVAARVWVGGRAIALRNDPNPANATWWGRVVVTPTGGTEYQTNNNPNNQGSWSR